MLPPNPSFLDLRNGILVANESAANPTVEDAIWAVFTNRGMGVNARATNAGNDQPPELNSPAAGFNAPPSTAPANLLTPKVTFKVQKRKARRIRVTGSVDRADRKKKAETPRGTVQLIVRQKQGKKSKLLNRRPQQKVPKRIGKKFSRNFDLSTKLPRAGRWQVSVKFDARQPFKDVQTRAKTVRVR